MNVGCEGSIQKSIAIIQLAINCLTFADSLAKYTDFTIFEIVFRLETGRMVIAENIGIQAIFF